jgi:hypothetical protein
MNTDNELYYRPLKVYVIRNKAGAFAPRTKVYPSKAGGTMGFNSFVEAMLSYYLNDDNPVYRQLDCEMDALFHYWSWGGGKKSFGNYQRVHDELANPTGYRNPMKISRPAYDEFMRIIDKIYDEWSVEEITQDYA